MERIGHLDKMWNIQKIYETEKQTIFFRSFEIMWIFHKIFKYKENHWFQ